MTGHGFNLPSLEPTTQHFLDEIGSSGAFPFSGRSVARIRTALVALQSKPIGKPSASVEDMTWPVGTEPCHARGGLAPAIHRRSICLIQV